jgi:hypothetical protein
VVGHTGPSEQKGEGEEEVNKKGKRMNGQWKRVEVGGEKSNFLL